MGVGSFVSGNESFEQFETGRRIERYLYYQGLAEDWDTSLPDVNVSDH